MVSVATLLVLMWPQATGTAAAKYIAMARGRGDPHAQAAVATYTARLTGWSTVVLGLVGVLWVGWYAGTGWVPAVSTGLLVVALGADTYVRGVRTGNNQFVTTAAWDMISSVLTLSMLGVVLVAGWEPVLLLPLCLGYPLFVLPSWPPPSPVALEAGTRRAVVGFTAWGSVQLLAASGLLQVSVVLGRAHDTLTALGLYGIAVSIATPASMLSGAMLTALSPAVARRFAAGDRVGLAGEVDRVVRIMVTVFLPVFGVLILWAGPVLGVVFGDRGTPAEALLVVLAVSVSVSSFNAANLRLNGAEAWGVKALAVCNVTGFLVGVGVILWAGPVLGVMGSAIGYLVGSVVSAVGPLVIVWRVDRMRWGLLVVRIATGYALVLTGRWWLGDQAHLAPALGASAVFLTLWVALSYRDLAPLARTVIPRHSR